ncbi:MAG: hypothetical protein HZB23_15765 [Deltaproteobacteria bacterium]|nr:hypothetical protein [Deltaproteobacteria bacterium]
MEALETVARLMEISAITAPKSRGLNFVKTLVLAGEDVKKLASAMLAFGERTEKKDFDRDARGVATCDVVMLIGIKDAAPLGLDCGACGFASCKDLADRKKHDGEFLGPVCAFRQLDFGIALGSAVKTAQMMNVDNRIMYRMGVAAREAKMIDWDFAMGIPLSVTGKNVFFDR